MSESEQRIRELEEEIPYLAGEAFAAARAAVLASGHSVLQSERGVIYEVFPDGRRIERKRIDPPVPTKKGTTFNLW
jgi:hypothetical protein